MCAGAHAQPLPYVAFFEYFLGETRKYCPPAGKTIDNCVYETVKALRIVLMALFSSRDTCACEIPSAPATSVWVLPS